MKRKQNFLLQNIGGQDVIVPLGNEVVNMNGLVLLSTTGCWLWNLLAEDHSLDELVAALEEQFEVDSGCARADIQAFLDDITRLGLLET